MLRGTLRPHIPQTSYNLVRPGKKAGMVVVGKLVHGRENRICLHPAHVVIHCSEKRLSIAVKSAVITVAVLLHPCQKPGHGLHKRIIIHNGIPLIPLKPAGGIAIVLCQDQNLRIYFLYSLSKHLPERMVILCRMPQVSRHIQTPAVYAVRRGNPFFCHI